MIIRDATIDDFPDLYRMGIAFAAAAEMPEVDPDTFYRSVEMLISDGILKVAVNSTICGGAGALVFPHYWNEKEIVAQELFWWVDENARKSSAAIRLLSEMESEAREKGAKSLIMITLDKLTPEVLERLYIRRGYRPQERAFIKEL